MSSFTFYDPGHGNSAQAKDWWEDDDGAIAFVLNKSTDDKRRVWDLTTYLASGESVSSAAYSDRGMTTSSKSVSTPQIIFTATGYGETEVQATLSTGRVVTRVFRSYPPSGVVHRDYQT